MRGRKESRGWDGGKRVEDEEREGEDLKRRKEDEDEEEGFETNEPKIPHYNNLCHAMPDQHALSPCLLHDSIPSQSHARGESGGERIPEETIWLLIMYFIQHAQGLASFPGFSGMWTWHCVCGESLVSILWHNQNRTRVFTTERQHS